MTESSTKRPLRVLKPVCAHKNLWSELEMVFWF